MKKKTKKIIVPLQEVSMKRILWTVLFTFLVANIVCYLLSRLQIGIDSYTIFLTDNRAPFIISYFLLLLFYLVSPIKEITSCIHPYRFVTIDNISTSNRCYCILTPLAKDFWIREHWISLELENKGDFIQELLYVKKLIPFIQMLILPTMIILELQLLYCCYISIHNIYTNVLNSVTLTLLIGILLSIITLIIYQKTKSYLYRKLEQLSLSFLW